MFGVAICTVVRWTEHYGLPYTRDGIGNRRIDLAAAKAFVRPASRSKAPKRECVLADGRAHYGHGYCRPHYLRWRRCGDPQVGKPLRPYRQYVFGQYNRSRSKPAPSRAIDLIDTDEI